MINRKRKVNSFHSSLNMKTDEIDTVEKRQTYKIAVLGCEPQGIALGAAFANAGFRVTLADPDQSAVRRVTKGRSGTIDYEFESDFRSFLRSGRLLTTSDLKPAIAQASAIVVAINPKIDDKKKIDSSEVEKLLKFIGANLKQGTIIIYTGVASIGFMKNIAKENLINTSGLKVGEDFGLAYSPLWIFNKSLPPNHISNLGLLLAADDKNSLEAASAIFATICKSIQKVTNFKTAELTRLFSAARCDTNIALTNELATLCENADADYLEIMKLLDENLLTTTFSPTIDAENMKEAQILLENAEDYGAKLRLATLARQLNDDMVGHGVKIIKNALRSCGRTLRRSKITLIGTASAGAAGERIIKILEAKGAKVTSADSLKTVSGNSVRMKKKRTFTEKAESSDCLVFLRGQELQDSLDFKSLRTIMHSPAAIVDLAGALEPSKVETEGFIYRGLGRGTGKK